MSEWNLLSLCGFQFFSSPHGMQNAWKRYEVSIYKGDGILKGRLSSLTEYSSSETGSNKHSASCPIRFSYTPLKKKWMTSFGGHFVQWQIDAAQRLRRTLLLSATSRFQASKIRAHFPLQNWHCFSGPSLHIKTSFGYGPSKQWQIKGLGWDSRS